MEARKKELPTVIFVDNNHFSTLLPNLLVKLGIQLKKLGYDHFYEEIPWSTQDFINKLDEKIQKGKEIIFHFEKIQEIVINIIKETGYDSLVHKLRAKTSEESNVIFNEAVETFIQFNEGLKAAFASYLSNPILKDRVEEAIISQLSQFSQMNKFIHVELPACQKNCLIKLNDSNIAIIPVDEGGNSVVEKVQAVKESMLDNPMTIEDTGMLAKRDNAMASIYLKASHAVFGKIGFLHLPGMQKIIMEKSFSLEAAKAKFCFIYPYDEKIIHPMQLTLQNNELNLPLGLAKFGPVKEGDLDKIANQIIKTIEDKIEILNQASSKDSLNMEENYANKHVS